MATKGGDRTCAIFFFISFDIAHGRFFDGIIIWQLFCHQQWASWQPGAFTILAADTQEVVIGDAMGLINLALVAALFQSLLWQGCRRTGTGNQDRIWVGRQNFQDLAGDRSVTAGKAFIGNHFEFAQFGNLGEFLEPTLTISIRKTDESDCLDAYIIHVTGNRSRHM